MAHILLVTGSFRGSLNRIGGFAAYLRKGGHEITLAIPEHFQPLMEERGLPYRIFRPFFPPTPHERSWWKKKPAKGKTRMQEAIEALQIERFDQIVAELQPDLLLIDIEQHHLVSKAPSYQLPFALLLGWYTIWKRPGIPLIHRHTVPGEGFKGSKLGLELSWTKHRLKKWLRNRKSWLRDGGTDRLSLLKALARQTGFPFRQEAEKYQWLIPVSYKSLPVLTTVLEELEFPTQNRPNLHYLGPMVFLDRKEADFTNPEIERRLEELSAEKEAGKYSKVVYWATSSILSTEITLLKRIIEVMRRHPEWLLILGMGKKLQVEQLGELPSNVAPFPFLPQLKVLAFSDCCFHHGGINTLNECIHFKVPCIIYSGGVMDGPGVTARIAYHKIGIVGDAKTDTVEDIEEHIERMFSDPDILENMDRVYRAYQEGRGKGLEVVNMLLEAGHPVAQ